MDDNLKILKETKKMYQSYIQENDNEVEQKRKLLQTHINDINELNLSKDDREQLIIEIKKKIEKSISDINSFTEKYQREIKKIEKRIQNCKQKPKKKSQNDSFIDQNQQGQEDKQNSHENLDQSNLSTQDQNSMKTSNSSDQKNNEASEEKSVLSENQIQQSQKNNELTTQETNKEKNEILDLINNLQKQIDEYKQDNIEKDRQFQAYKNEKDRQFQAYKNEKDRQFQAYKNENNKQFQAYKNEKEIQIEILKTQIEFNSDDLKRFQQRFNEIEAIKLRSQLITIIYDYIAKDYGYKDFQEFKINQTQFEKKKKTTQDQAMLVTAKKLGFIKQEWDILVQFKRDRNKIFHPNTQILLNKVNKKSFRNQIEINKVINLYLKKLLILYQKQSQNDKVSN